MKVYVVLYVDLSIRSTIEFITSSFDKAKGYAVEETNQRHPMYEAIVITEVECKKVNLIGDGWYVRYGGSKDWDYFDYFIEEWEVTE